MSTPAGASNTYSSNFENPTSFLNTTPKGNPVYYPENVTEVLEVLNVESNHKHSGHVWLLNPWHFTSRRKTTENQDIHTMGLTQDHREKRHPHHEGKPVYYPENVVEVLEVAAQIEFYCDRGEGGSDETGRQAHGCGKQHLNMRDSRGFGGSGGVGGEKAMGVLEVDQFYIAGDADTESKQLKLEDI
ncbi:hypothetical protein DFH08DRAFT_816821 [Mycena albidolilacea]|uniref:Uncharacterized protein n=1 Tax=Mycena albidolilacea TaxID=1033008 RepID=A0AAD6ZJG5_9AGAR|nr:hypothetical protein DFH08DRAFT_816821 [Mycena albidolilacea]